MGINSFAELHYPAKALDILSVFFHSLNMKMQEAKSSKRVIYVPTHAHGNINHPDCEHGKISSANEKFVFVKFDKQVEKLGWNGTTSRSCRPEYLVEE